VPVVAGFFLSMACGGSTRTGEAEQGAASAGSGTKDVGEEPSEVGGSAGSAGASVGGSDGGGGAAPRLPGGKAEEEAIIAPLYADLGAPTDDLDELMDLAIQVGLARGYAQCRCFRSPMAAPAQVTELLAICGKDEAGGVEALLYFPPRGTKPVANLDVRRCLLEAAPTSAWPESLRCVIERTQQDGRAWVDWCPADHDELPMTVPSGACELTDAWVAALSECQSITYCGDGARVSGRRCDRTPNCEDSSDERGCFDLIGRDNVECGGRLVSEYRPCLDECFAALEPPVCDPARNEDFICADGKGLSREQLCDHAKDCTDGRDEQYCAP
jgi:hypothetical protein